MTKKNVLKRREFLATSAAVVGAPLVVRQGVLASQGTAGANDRVMIGHIGFGGRSRGLFGELGALRAKGETESIAVCEVDEKRLANASRQIGPQADVYRDYRYILERQDIDAVVIGTPDHWHGVQFVHSAEAGKHIYCEKPACCTIEESRAMVAAAKKAGIASQIGSQGRSQPEAYLMHRYIRNVLGKVSHVECFHYPSPEDNTQTADGQPPAALDWDFWLGPLRYRPYNSKHHHGVFRWLLESGGGQIRDRGAHVMSCAMHWMEADGTGPVSVEASGTSPRQGLWDSAVLMDVKYTFKDPDWTMNWTQMPMDEVARKYKPDDGRADRNPPGGRISRPGYGAVYHGENGTATHWGGDGGTWAENKVLDWEPPAGFTDVRKSPGHMQDWFDGIRTGKKTIMDIEWGAGVANLTILGNISFILGREIQWDQATQSVVGDDQAQRMMSRPQRHPYHL